MNDLFQPLRRMLATIGGLLTASWIVFGPGPKYEEGFAILGMGVLLLLVGVAAAAVAPTPWFNGFYYPALFSVGFTATAIHVALLYGEPFQLPWLGWAWVSFLVGVLVLLPLNRLSLFLWKRAVS